MCIMERCSSQRGKQTPEIVCAVEEKEGKQCFYEQSQKLQWMENGKSWKEKYTQTRLPSNRKKNHWRSHSIKHYRSFYIKDDISHQCSQTSVLNSYGPWLSACWTWAAQSSVLLFEQSLPDVQCLQADCWLPGGRGEEWAIGHPTPPSSVPATPGHPALCEYPPLA